MTNAPNPSPTERIATVFGWLLAGVRRGLASNQARLEGPVQVALYGLIVQRIAQTRDRLIRLVERLQAGWVYQPRPYAPRHRADPPADRPPRTTNKLATGSHWLVRAAPGPDMGAANQALYTLLHEPEIVALLAAAPVPAWRILRSVCWAFGVRKPVVLGPSKPPKPGKPLYHPPRPLPWEVPLVPEPDTSYYFQDGPRYYWPRVPIKPRTT